MRNKFKVGNIPWNKGLKGCFKHSFESKEKISLAKKGKSFTKEHLKNMSLSQLGKGHKQLEETKKRIANSLMGHKMSEETKNKIRLKHIGQNISFEHRKKISAKNQEIDINNWKEFTSFFPYNDKFNINFKRLIRKRDNQICMLCGIHREKLKRALDIHHINYNKLLSTKENCISLCRSCHNKTTTNRNEWTIFFQKVLSDKYNYQYTPENIIFKIEEIK